jgi:hypothetical protein
MAKARAIAFLAAVLATVGLLWAPGAQAAATRQVSPSGTDSGDCVAAACATVQYAVEQAQTGDTVSVAAGDYDEEVTIAIPGLTLAGAPGGGTTIGPEGEGVKAQTEIVLTGAADQTVLRDLEVISRAQGQAAITANGNEAIDDVTIEAVDVTGIGPSTPPTTVGNGLEVKAPGSGWRVLGDSFSGCYLGFAIFGEMEDLTLEGADFHGNRAGFYVERTLPLTPSSTGEVDGLTLRDSEFVDNEYVGLYFEGLSEATIEGVSVSDTGVGVSSLPSGARAMVVNLKAGDAKDITVSDSSFTGSVNEGILVQARGWAGDNPTYEAAPASLESFRLLHSVVSGNGGPGVIVQNRSTLDEASISGSRIVDNGSAGFGVTAPVNGVFARAEGAGPTDLEAADDWFGCNAGPLSGEGCDTTGPGVQVPAWLVLSASVTPSPLSLGGQATVRADLDTNSAGEAAGPAPDGVPVSFGYPLGVFVQPQVLLQGGAASSALTATQVGAGEVTVSADAQQLSLPLEVLAPPVQTPPPPPPPAPPKVEPAGGGGPKAVPDSGQVTVATVSCASESCDVVAKAPKVKIGGKSYKVKVKVPATMSAGDKAPVKVVLPKQTRKALEAEGKGKVTLTLTVTNADGTKKTVNVTVMLKAKGKKGKGH